MKKVLKFALAALSAALVLSFTACDPNDDEKTTTTADDTPVKYVEYSLVETPSDAYDYTPKYLFKFDGKEFEANTTEFCYDSEGNVYFLNLNMGETTFSAEIKSSKPGFEAATISVENFQTENFHMAIDTKTDALYLGGSFYSIEANGRVFEYHKYEKLISSNGSDTTSEIKNITVEDFLGDFAVNNNVLYALHNSYYSYSGSLPKFYKIDLAAEEPSLEKLWEMTEENAKSLGLDSAPSFTDIICQDGALYVLVSDAKDLGLETSYVSIRGLAAKYDIANGSFKILGWLDSQINLESKYIYSYKNIGDYRTQVYTHLYDSDSNSGTRYKIMMKASDFIFTVESFGEDAEYPLKLYGLESEETKAFACPQKFLAVTPKKLVIADDGLAFYTDINSALCFKNMNRVVTVDLEDFVISTCAVTDAEFNNDYAEFSILASAMGSGYSVKDADLYKADTAKTKVYDASENTNVSLHYTGANGDAATFNIANEYVYNLIRCESETD